MFCKKLAKALLAIFCAIQTHQLCSMDLFDLLNEQNINFIESLKSETLIQSPQNCTSPLKKLKQRDQQHNYQFKATPPEQSESKVKCPLGCGVSMKQSYVQRHINNSCKLSEKKSESKYVCLFCFKKFKQKSNLDEHLYACKLNPTKYSFPCTFLGCQKICKNPRSLKKHIKLIHPAITHFLKQ